MRILNVLLLLVLSGCASTPQQQKSDEYYSQLLVGTWVGQYSYDNGAEISYGEKTYMPDGTAVGFISDRVRISTGEYKEVSHTSYTSKWRIEGGVVIIWGASYEPPVPNSEKSVIRDKIISFDGDRAVFEDVSDGSKFVRFRKNGI